MAAGTKLIEDNGDLKHFELEASDGSIARITNLGATLTALYAPDMNGRMADVVMGYDTAAEYRDNVNAFGCICGRFANRIAKGRFTLDGTTYQLATNNGENHLHGGVNGFHTRLFDAETCTEDGSPALRLRYTSPDGEENYPGTLKLTVTYVLFPGPDLLIRYQAVTDAPTIVNLTNHSYFNLAGHAAGSIEDHIVQIDALQVVEADASMIPTGELLEVGGTPFDFRSPAPVQEKLAIPHQGIEDAFGYDAAFILNANRDEEDPASRIVEPESGRILETFTTQPVLHLYSAGCLTPVKGKDGAFYQKSGGFCLETQHIADSPNHPEFPSTVLRPGDMFHEETRFSFSVV